MRGYVTERGIGEIVEENESAKDNVPHIPCLSYLGAKGTLYTD